MCADAANRIAPCGDSNRIRTRIGQEIPRSDINIEYFPKFQNGSVGKNALINTKIETRRHENYQ